MTEQLFYNAGDLTDFCQVAFSFFVAKTEVVLLRSLDIYAEKEYTYNYEEGVLSRAVQYSVTLDSEKRQIARTVENPKHEPMFWAFFFLHLTNT